MLAKFKGDQKSIIMSSINCLKDKIQLQNWLNLKATNSLNKINITTYFENLIIELYVPYALNTHVKFCVNRILFTI